MTHESQPFSVFNDLFWQSGQILNAAFSKDISFGSSISSISVVLGIDSTSVFCCSNSSAGLSIILVVVAFLMLIILSITSYFVFDHVQKRINTFFDPSADTYQIDLSLKAFKSGGLFGKGPAQGVLKEKIPDASTDFIFAVAGEELGLIFCSLIIILILLLIIRFLLLLLKFKDPYIIIAIVGLISSYGLQSLINIFSSLELIPTKGMTLPFISYGGSSMISTSILFGFLLSLTKQNNEKK